MSEEKPQKSLDDLEAKLRQAREGSENGGSGGPALKKGDMSGFSMAFRIGTEMVSALVVGVGVGWFLDNWLETTPWFLVVFFFLGAGAGIMNVYRAASGLGYQPGYGPTKGDAPEGGNQMDASQDAGANNKDAGGK